MMHVRLKVVCLPTTCASLEMNAILAVAAAVASTAVRLDIANQPAAARCPGDVILAVYGRSDYNENIDDSTWLDDDMVNMIGGSSANLDSCLQ